MARIHLERIHLDIDDTIADTTTAFIEYVKNNYGVILNRNSFLTHSYASCIPELPKDKDHIRDFVNSIYFKKIIPIQDSEEIIKKLSKHNDFVIISGRSEAWKEETRSWLNKFFPSCFSEINLVNQYPRPGETKLTSKHELCKYLECTLAIDDDPYTALQIHNSCIEVMLFDQPWNKNLNNGIKRVFNWKEIYSNIIKY